MKAAYLLLFSTTLLSLGCESRVSLGARCASASDCAPPYVCGVSGRCRVACTVSADCPVGERCLVDARGVPSCSIDRETCTTDCAEGLECVAGECQSGCTSSTACPDSVCTIEGYCLTPTTADAAVPTDASAQSDAPGDAGGCGTAPPILHVGVGASETCAVTTTNEVYCWGYFPAVGPTGAGVDCVNGPSACYPRPQRMAGITDGLDIVISGRSYACALRTNHHVACWGAVDGVNDATPVEIVVDETGAPLVATRLVAGDQHVCAIENVTGDVRCWGRHSLGRLGDGVDVATVTTRAVLATELPVTDLGALTLATGYETTLALGTDGLLRAVGANEHGQLGAAPSPFSLVAVRNARSGATAVAGSGNHTCVLDAAGMPRCMGLEAPLLGPSPTGLVPCATGDGALCTNVLGAVASATPFEDLLGDPVGDLMFGITDDGTVYGWGSSDTRLLPSPNVTAPVAVTALAGARTHRLSVRHGTACAVREVTGELLCWGRNDDGQLGRGTTSPDEAEAMPPCW